MLVHLILPLRPTQNHCTRSTHRTVMMPRNIPRSSKRTRRHCITASLHRRPRTHRCWTWAFSHGRMWQRPLRFCLRGSVSCQRRRGKTVGKLVVGSSNLCGLIHRYQHLPPSLPLSIPPSPPPPLSPHFRRSITCAKQASTLRRP